MHLEPQAGFAQLLGPLVFMAAILVLFYVIIIKPTKARQKQHEDLVANLQEGEMIVTAGGIFGKVLKVREDTVDIEVAPNVRLKMDRRAIRRRAGEKP